MKKIYLFILLIIILVIALFSKECSVLYPPLPPDVMEKQGLTDQYCKCLGIELNLNRMIVIGEMTKTHCIGVPISYKCNRFIQGDYREVKCN